MHLDVDRQKELLLDILEILALEAILRKKSISLQKPMCLNISEANKLISEAKKADVSLKIFENLRNFLFLGCKNASRLFERRHL